VKKLVTILFVSAVFAALGAAQGFGMFGGGAGSEYMNLTRKDVRKELKVTDEQASKLDAAQQDMRDQMRQVFQDSQGDRDAMQAGIKKLMEGLGTTIKGILTADQLKRLHEVNLQMQGATAILDPEVQKSLNLTADQISRVKDLQSKQQAANASLREKMQNGEIDRSEIGPLMMKNNDALKAALDKILTDDQRTQLKALGGDKFEQDPNEKGPGFGPRGGGGGGN